MENFVVSLLIDELDEGLDSAFILHDLGAVLRSVSFIGQDDPYTGVEEGLFAESLMQCFESILNGVEDLVIRKESDRCSGRLAGPDHFQIRLRFAAGESLTVYLPVVRIDGDFQPLGEGVYDRSADAVQTSGEMISLAAEFSSRMKHRINDCDSGQSDLGLNADRNTSSVVGDFDDLSRKDLYIDLGAVSCKCLIDGVVHDLIHQMMKACRSGRSDIHTGTLAYSFQSFKDLNVGSVVCAFLFNNFLDFFFHLLPYFYSSISLSRSPRFASVAGETFVIYTLLL